MEETSSHDDILNLAELVDFLQRYNLKQTELCFMREYNLHNNQNAYNSTTINDYFTVYSCLSNFIFNSSYQLELIQCLFIIFFFCIHLLFQIEKDLCLSKLDRLDSLERQERVETGFMTLVQDFT